MPLFVALKISGTKVQKVHNLNMTLGDPDKIMLRKLATLSTSSIFHRRPWMHS